MPTVMNTRVADAADAGRARLPVPWSTVFPLAVVAAYGSGFWLIVARGAVGAIQRTQTPFASWLQESTLLLPLYVFAVLAALTLALHWFGHGPHRPRTVAVTLLLVALATTLTAVVVQAISAAYDYRLESTQEATMAANMPTCGPLCVADQQQSALFLQVHALGLNGLVMLVSNLVLLGFVVAFRGGRLDVASPGGNSKPLPSAVWPGSASNTRPDARTHDHDRDRVGLADLECVLVAGLLAAAAIHATVIREHLTEWPAAGVFFILLTIAETAAAALVFVLARPAAFLATVAVSAGPILVWLYSRTAGMPFGPDPGVPEPVGLADLAACLLEATTLALAFALLRPRRRPRGRPRRVDSAQQMITLALVGVIALGVIGAAGGLGLFGAQGGMHMGQPVHHVTASSEPA